MLHFIFKNEGIFGENACAAGNTKIYAAMILHMINDMNNFWKIDRIMPDNTCQNRNTYKGEKLMPFKINEAPQIALNALTKNTVKRGCGTFWSLACCLFTCGCSVCSPCESKNTTSDYEGPLAGDTEKDYRSCCYPRAISSIAQNELAKITQDLQKLIKSQKEISSEIIDKQVHDTLEVLTTFIKQNSFKARDVPDGYVKALCTARSIIQNKNAQFLEEEYKAANIFLYQQMRW